MPRALRYTKRVNVFVSQSMLMRLLVVLREGETMPDVIRAAIEKLLEERE